jgi:hypothetical protein
LPSKLATSQKWNGDKQGQGEKQKRYEDLLRSGVPYGLYKVFYTEPGLA